MTGGHHGLGVGVPGNEDAGGGHVADVEAADGGQGAELRRGGRHQGAGLQGGGARAPRPGRGSRTGRGQPLPVLGEPQLLGEALARAQDRVVCNITSSIHVIIIVKYLSFVFNIATNGLAADEEHME